MNKIICSETRNPQQPIEEVVYRKTRTFSANRLNFGSLGIPAAIKIELYQKFHGYPFFFTSTVSVQIFNKNRRINLKKKFLIEYFCILHVLIVYFQIKHYHKKATEKHTL